METRFSQKADPNCVLTIEPSADSREFLVLKIDGPEDEGFGRIQLTKQQTQQLLHSLNTYLETL